MWKKADHKITIEITTEAYAKIAALIIMSPVEIGWNSLVRQKNDTTYEIYDVIMYPQTVTAVRTTDVTPDNRWLESLTNDQINNMAGWCHSHVKMRTIPSTIDVDTWKEKLKNMTSRPFYLFQIWNKFGEVASFFVDLKTKTLYSDDNVELQINSPVKLAELNAFTEWAESLLTYDDQDESEGAEDGSFEID